MATGPTDAAGNVGNDTAVVTIDTVAPNAPVLDPINATDPVSGQADRRHSACKADALPTELSALQKRFIKVAQRTGLEPATPGVTGR
ncbi:hypothetical protein ACSRDJ_19515, partial [Acinetobacter baumannii]